MKIFSAMQIRKWDEYTISKGSVSSIDLMERASTACCKWLIGKNYGGRDFHIFCGKGNNGGDGLALARLLLELKSKATVYILDFGNSGTPDFQANLERLHLLTKDIHFLQSAEFFPQLPDEAVVVDAIIGTGLTKALGGTTAELAAHLNRLKREVIAIDMPTGLFADESSIGNIVVNASQTLSFQTPKLAFMLPENEPFCGEVHILDIGLSAGFEVDEPASYEIVDGNAIRGIYQPRKKFSHKGNFGHAAMLTGSKGMIGAAVLSSLACLRTGVGKLTSYLPGCGYEILQNTVPEAMCRVTGEDHLLAVGNLDSYEAIGIGPGIGRAASNFTLLKDVFSKVKRPMLIDADALNTIADNPELLTLIPPLSILTPHPKEFERLFGKVENNVARLRLCCRMSATYNIHIILKGHFSFISIPLTYQAEGPGLRGYFNPTGNPGMAKAGSGDVLSGILTALLAQGYNPLQSAVLGTWLHGKAGDIAAELFAPETMLAGDIIQCLSQAFRELAVTG